MTIPNTRWYPWVVIVGVFCAFAPPGQIYSAGQSVSSSRPGTGALDDADVPAKSESASGLSHHFAKFEVPFPDADQTLPNGINDQDQIVGAFHDTSTGFRAFVEDHGRFRPFDFPLSGTIFTGVETHAQGINNRGQIVGYIDAFLPPHECCESHGFVFTRGVFSLLDVPGSVQTIATGINDRGQIVGVYVDGTGAHGFLLERGVLTVLDVPFPEAHDTIPFGINNRGQIVGTYDSLTQGSYTQGFIFERGVFTHLDTPPSSITNGTLVNGINDRGQIVGCVDGHAFVADGGAFTPLDIPLEAACPLGINNSGKIVGTYLAPGGVPQGFVGVPRRPVRVDGK